MAEKSAPFGPGLLEFLRELDLNNDREWFERNKQRYEDEVREPALAFVHAMAPQVERLSPHLQANARRVGGSLMRVQRDVRFSLDKRPYKTNLGIHFRHEAGRDVHAPGVYFHVDPGQVFLGAGMWRPDGPALGAVRRAIVEDPAAWLRARDGKKFRAAWELGGESLKRPPRGFDAGHELIEDLKRTDHIAVSALDRADVTRPDLVRLIAERMAHAREYLGFLAQALGLSF
jgi:uncharacterized protein (TIGR02453 family)